MMRDRTAAQVWLTLIDQRASDFDETALAAGLAPLGKAWVEVDSGRAKRFLAGLLRVNLAYKNELMPKHRADWLADEFIRAWGPDNLRFATNSSDLPGRPPYSWTPATDWTFDAGVAVIGDTGSAIYWVADED
jgi:hypothetical protein